MEQDWRGKLAQARWRLDLQHALRILPWSLAGWLAGAGAIIALDRLYTWELGCQPVVLSALVGSLATVLLLVGLRRRRMLDAAVALDASCGLKERLSTLYSIDHGDQNATPVAHALRADLEKHARLLDVPASIPIGLTRAAWLPALPTIAIVLAATLLQPLDATKTASAKEVTSEERTRMEEEAQRLAKSLKEREKLAEEEGVSEELEAITAEIEKAAQEIRENKDLTPREAALKLSDLSKKLEDRQAATENVDRMKRALAGLNPTEGGPASKLEQALRQGDFKEAAQQIQALKKQIEEGDLSADEKKKLADQLAQMEQQIKKAAELAERAKELKQNLSPEEAKKQLEKLAESAKDLEQLGELAKSLGECSKCLGGKDGEGADGEKNGSAPGSLADKLDEAKRMLDQLALDDAERKMLDDMLKDVGQCRGGMCQGGKGQGNGLGKGQGSGDRPEAENDTRGRQTRARSEVTDGKTFVTGKIDGPIFQGESKAEIRQAVASAARAADEAVTRQQIPSDLREHTRDYFERLHGKIEDAD